MQNDTDTKVIQEQALIGALVSGVSPVEIEGFLTAEMFRSADVGHAYQLVFDILEEGGHPTPMTVASRVPKLKSGLVPFEFFAACAHLYKKLTADKSFDIRSAAVAIKEEYVAVRLDGLGGEISKNARERTPNPEIIKQVIQDIGEISVVSGLGSSDTLEEAGKRSLEAISEAYKRQEIDGVPWGFTAISEAADGPMQYGNFHGLLLDSGGGKTSMALQIIRHNAEQQIPCLFFSFEQTKVQCLQQMAAQKLGIQANKFRKGEIDEDQFFEISKDHRYLATLPIDIITASGMNARDIAFEMTRFNRRYGRGFCAIDHAKSIRLNSQMRGMAEQMNEMYVTIRDAAKSSDLATLILMQRLRSALERDNPAPTILDVYGGSSGQEAVDVLFGMYRPVMGYKIKKDTAATQEKAYEFQEKMNAEKDQAWLYTLKNRYAQEGPRRRLKWEPEYTRFKDHNSHNSMQSETLNF